MANLRTGNDSMISWYGFRLGSPTQKAQVRVFSVEKVVQLPMRAGSACFGFDFFGERIPWFRLVRCFHTCRCFSHLGAIPICRTSPSQNLGRDC